jgi:uncharacterized membrane protein YoaK (UPF0700 family)
VVLLGLTAGVADATAFLAFGRVFSSVMTGNMVLLGVGAASHDAAEALRAGLAIAGYSVGVLAGVPIAAQTGRRRTWPVAVTGTLTVEACLLIAFAAVWEATTRQGDASIALLILLAAAMGLQAAAVRRLGQMSSTYLTGTLTSVIASLATRRRYPGLARDVGVMLAVIAGALAGGLLVRFGPAWVPVPVLLPLLAVIGWAAVSPD